MSSICRGVAGLEPENFDKVMWTEEKLLSQWSGKPLVAKSLPFNGGVGPHNNLPAKHPSKLETGGKDSWGP